MRAVNVVIGLVVLLMGAWKYIFSIDSVSKILGFIGAPGETIFNIILIAAGIILIGYGIRRPMPMMIRR